MMSAYNCQPVNRNIGRIDYLPNAFQNSEYLPYWSFPAEIYAKH
jgi:hypothetical protein